MASGFLTAAIKGPLPMFLFQFPTEGFHALSKERVTLKELRCNTFHPKNSSLPTAFPEQLCASSRLSSLAVECDVWPQ